MKDKESIGARIRQRRKEMGYTLRELADMMDVSPSFLSQVERNQINASINSLRRIAEALGVSMLYFVKEQPKPDPVLQDGSRFVLQFSDTSMTYELLTPRSSRAMEVFIGRLGPNTLYDSRNLTESTEECIYLLSGQMVISLESGEYTLQPGDSIYFEGFNLLQINNPGEQEAMWISVVAPPVF